MRNKPTGEYPADWPEIAERVKAAHGWRCERCGHPHDVAAGYMLTVHHLDLNKSNCAGWNLAALCQRCHLRIQGRVFLPQCWMFEHSAWFVPHLEGYLEAMRERNFRPEVMLARTGGGRAFRVATQGRDDPATPSKRS